MFDSASSSYMSKAWGTTADSDKTQTYSFWHRRTVFGVEQDLFMQRNGGQCYIFFDTNDRLNVAFDAAYTAYIPAMMFRDPTAWYHIVVRVDTTQVTSTDRVKVDVNGVEQTDINTNHNMPQNTTTDLLRTGGTMAICRNEFGTDDYVDGLLADVHVQDGIVGAATDFGEFDASGVWKPITASVSYGTNGFHIDFRDSSDLGDDESGNANDFTASGMGTDHQVADTPGRVYPIISPVDHVGTSTPATISEGGRKAAGWSNDRLIALSMPVIESGCYLEAVVDTAGDEMFGLWVSSTKPLGAASTSSPHTDSASCVLRVATNTVYNEGSSSSFSPATISSADVLMLAYKDGQFFYGKNGTWENSAVPNSETGELFTIASSSEKTIHFVIGRSGAGGPVYTIRTEEADWSYTAPTWAVPISSFNMPEAAVPKPSNYFDVALYTGNGTAIGSSGNEISSLDFQPDLVWIKNRDAADGHRVFDAVRGATKYVVPDAQQAQVTDTESLSTFDADGFTVGDEVGVNTNTENYVSWNWKGDGSSGASNSDGTITTTINAIATTGVSFGTFTGNATAGATLGHGLSAAPDFVFLQDISNGSKQIAAYHSALGGTKYLVFDTTGSAVTSSIYWNDTDASSSVITIGSHSDVNASGQTFGFWAFTEVSGFSKFGSFEGNGNANGPVVYCGFRPALVICKSIDSTSSWHMHDYQREGYNVDNDDLYVDSASAEGTADQIDFLANGFKLRISTDPNVAETYVFMAFAENPSSGGSNVHPATAR